VCVRGGEREETGKKRKRESMQGREVEKVIVCLLGGEKVTTREGEVVLCGLEKEKLLCVC